MSNPFLTVPWKQQGSGIQQQHAPRVKCSVVQEDQDVHQLPKSLLALAQVFLLLTEREGGASCLLPAWSSMLPQPSAFGGC